MRLWINRLWTNNNLITCWALCSLAGLPPGQMSGGDACPDRDSCRPFDISQERCMAWDRSRRLWDRARDSEHTKNKPNTEHIHAALTHAIFHLNCGHRSTRRNWSGDASLDLGIRSEHANGSTAALAHRRRPHQRGSASMQKRAASTTHLCSSIPPSNVLRNRK